MALTVTTNLLAIPEKRDSSLNDLNIPFFAGAENDTKNIKIVAQIDPVWKWIWIIKLKSK
jgi:hypothetical protein